jgi:hypothetical protein
MPQIAAGKKFKRYALQILRCCALHMVHSRGLCIGSRFLRGCVRGGFCVKDTDLAGKIYPKDAIKHYASFVLLLLHLNLRLCKGDQSVRAHAVASTLRMPSWMKKVSWRFYQQKDDIMCFYGFQLHVTRLLADCLCLSPGIHNREIPM